MNFQEFPITLLEFLSSMKRFKNFLIKNLKRFERIPGQENSVNMQVKPAL